MHNRIKQTCNRWKYLLLTLTFALMLIPLPATSSISKAGTNAQRYYKANGNEGAITGTVSFKGTKPKRKHIDMSQDNSCHSINPEATVQNVMLSKGQLANVIVYIKSGGELEKYYFEYPSSSVTIDRQFCQFVPRIVAIQSGQMLKILNNDVTSHNFHPVPAKNVEWNRSQSMGAEPLEQSFKYPEIIPIKCNRHPWMQAFVGVFHHPFFFVTGKDGSFKIDGVPPGRYTIAVWHEVFGEQTIEVTINPQETKNLPFTFNTKVAYAPASLKEEKAIILQ
jgi:hypothetical protein